MDDIEREVIQEKRVDLIANTLCNDILIRALRGKKLLGLAEVDSLETKRLNTGQIAQANLLYDILVTRIGAYDSLIETLESPDINQNEAAKILKEGREEKRQKQAVETSTEPSLSSNQGDNEMLGRVKQYLNATLTTFLQNGGFDDVTDANTLLLDYTDLVLKNEPLSVAVDFPNSDMKQKFKGQDFYDLPYERKGLALLVNIYNFDEYILKDNESHDPSEPSLYRTGANNDSTYMKTLWKQLGYSIFNETENEEKQGKWYKQDLLKMVQEFKKACEETKPESIVVYIGSHGFLNKIVTSDPPTREWNDFNQQYDYTFVTVDLNQDITQYFYHHNCPELRGKSKIFLVSACQDFEPQRNQGDSSFGSEKGVSDMVVFTAQAAGLTAWRNPQTGSWFAHCLTFVMMKLAKEKSLLEILKMVVQTLENLKTNGELPKEQIPEIRDTGMKGLYFFMRPK